MKSLLSKLIVLMGCATLGSSYAKDLLIDDFKSENFENWETIPKEADYSGGFLKLATTTGQVLLNSAQELDSGEMNVKFSIETVSDDDFYYIGFQTVQPWMRDAIYLMVQGSSFVVVVAKGGELKFNQNLPDVSVVPGQEYEMTIQWAKDSVTFLLDGTTIFFTDEVAKIPVDPLFAFLAVNKTKSEGDPAALKATSLEITDL